MRPTSQEGLGAGGDGVGVSCLWEEGLELSPGLSEPQPVGASWAVGAQPSADFQAQQLFRPNSPTWKRKNEVNFLSFHTHSFIQQVFIGSYDMPGIVLTKE